MICPRCKTEGCPSPDEKSCSDNLVVKYRDRLAEVEQGNMKLMIDLDHEAIKVHQAEAKLTALQQEIESLLQGILATDEVKDEQSILDNWRGIVKDARRLVEGK